MRWMLSIPLLIGCGDVPQPTADLPAKPFHEEANPAPIQLDRLPAEVTGTRQTTSDNALSTFALKTRRTQARNPIGAKLTADLPFLPNKDQMRFRPHDMVVRFGDEVIPYATGRNSVTRHGHGWKIYEGQLVVAAPRHLPGEIVHVETQFLQRITEAVQEYRAPYSLRQGDKTYSGLLLPSPLEAHWEVTLPQQAQFSAMVALEELPIRDLKSDGAALSLLITAENQRTEVERIPLFPGKPALKWTVDLSRWEGQTVSITLKSDPVNGSEHDYVSAGAPVITAALPSFAPRRVVVIGLDTTRPDKLSFNGNPRPTSPKLDARIHRFTRFDNAWTPAPRTRPSFRAATTGRRPLNAVGATNLGEMMDVSGFATAGLVSNIHLNPRFDFARGFDFSA